MHISTKSRDRCSSVVSSRAPWTPWQMDVTPIFEGGFKASISDRCSCPMPNAKYGKGTGTDGHSPRPPILVYDDVLLHYVCRARKMASLPLNRNSLEISGVDPERH